MESVVSWARRTAEDHLLPLGRRWDHVVAVGAAAERIAGAFGDGGETLITAVFLHWTSGMRRSWL